LSHADGRAEAEAQLLQHLLHLALQPQQHSFEHGLKLLLQQPAAEQLAPSDVLQLLTAVLQADLEQGHPYSQGRNNVHRTEVVVRDVCRLPGAAAIDEQGVLQLLRVAMKSKPLLLPYLLRWPAV
jgi:hypothetical protein